MGGCSLTRFGYELAPSLAMWRISRFVSLEADQEDLVRRHLDALHAWHRKTQLQDYARLLRDVDDGMHARVEPATIGRWREQVRRLWRPLARQAAPGLAQFAATLRPAQLEEIRSRIEAENREILGLARGRPGDRGEVLLERRVERFAERIGYLIGDLTELQRADLRLYAGRLAASESAWYDERVARQQRILAYLDRVRVGAVRGEAAVQEARQMLETLFEPRDASRRAQIERSFAQANEVYASLLASATDQQRRTLRERLRAWIEDAEQLSSG